LNFTPPELIAAMRNAIIADIVDDRDRHDDGPPQS